jgi:hypothetical protein
MRIHCGNNASKKSYVWKTSHRLSQFNFYKTCELEELASNKRTIQSLLMYPSHRRRFFNASP